MRGEAGRIDILLAAASRISTNSNHVSQAELALPLSATVPIPCLERASLVNQLRCALEELFLIEDQQFDAVARRDLNGQQFLRYKLRDAHKHKDMLIRRLQDHILEHGCLAYPGSVN